MYWREYRTFVHIAQTYGLSESAVCRTVHAVETALLRSGQFTLPGKKALTQSDIAFEVVLVDAPECPVERPNKNSVSIKKQRQHYSGKKKRHTQKAQVVADPKTKRVLVTSFSEGKKHDFKLFQFKLFQFKLFQFKLFQETRLPLLPQTECLADSGYLGLAKQHPNSRLPKKKSKLHPLTDEQKKPNRQ